ncbi:hypothetical protein MUK42_24770 [Musa troglodytarum]|uniref:Uncharacterized protein n=1 Tax=Musa troglodytarum TaxID=320322 RepID=A0A9E7GRY4_9LILI|nr:hypothetical protein MUK42_24770 [Musa troglodytarum]
MDDPVFSGWRRASIDVQAVMSPVLLPLSLVNRFLNGSLVLVIYLSSYDIAFLGIEKMFPKLHCFLTTLFGYSALPISQAGRVYILDMYNAGVYPFDSKAKRCIDLKVELVVSHELFVLIECQLEMRKSSDLPGGKKYTTSYAYISQALKQQQIQL